MPPFSPSWNSLTPHSIRFVCPRKTWTASRSTSPEKLAGSVRERLLGGFVLGLLSGVEGRPVGPRRTAPGHRIGHELRLRIQHIERRNTVEARIRRNRPTGVRNDRAPRRVPPVVARFGDEPVKEGEDLVVGSFSLEVGRKRLVDGPVPEAEGGRKLEDPRLVGIPERVSRFLSLNTDISTRPNQLKTATLPRLMLKSPVESGTLTIFVPMMTLRNLSQTTSWYCAGLRAVPTVGHLDVEVSRVGRSRVEAAAEDGPLRSLR